MAFPILYRAIYCLAFKDAILFAGSAFDKQLLFGENCFKTFGDSVNFKNQSGVLPAFKVAVSLYILWEFDLAQEFLWTSCT